VPLLAALKILSELPSPHDPKTRSPIPPFLRALAQIEKNHPLLLFFFLARARRHRNTGRRSEVFFPLFKCFFPEEVVEDGIPELSPFCFRDSYNVVDFPLPFFPVEKDARSISFTRERWPPSHWPPLFLFFLAPRFPPPSRPGETRVEAFRLFSTRDRSPSFPSVAVRW